MNRVKTQEILIVGGGAIGLSIARRLHQKGAGRITILERGQAGREASYAAAGMLAPHAEAVRADEFFHFCQDSNRLYPQFAAELLAETGIDIELDRSGTLYLALTETDARENQRRFDWQRAAGLAVERLSAPEVRKLEPFVSPDAREALFFPNDWQVENRRLLAALQRYAALNQIEIVENAAVERLLIENGKVVGAQTATGTFAAETVVLTAGAWTSLIETGDFALPKIEPVRGQIIAFQTAKRLFQRVIYSPRGYLVPRLDGRILIGATVENAGFDKSVTAAGVELLRENALEIAPSLVNLNVAERWAGLRPRAADGLPILGAFPGIANLYVAAAHYRNGILLAPKTAEIITNLLLGNAETEYLKAFSPRRFQAARAV